MWISVSRVDFDEHFANNIAKNVFYLMKCLSKPKLSAAGNLILLKDLKIYGLLEETSQGITCT